MAVTVGEFGTDVNNRYKKVKWSRYRPGVAQRVGRGIALLFHDRGTRRGRGRCYGSICCHNTDLVHINGHDRTILVIFSQALYKAPWWWIILWSETCWSTFKYFIILTVSTYYILCISWILKCLVTCLYIYRMQKRTVLWYYAEYVGTAHKEVMP